MKLTSLIWRFHTEMQKEEPLIKGILQTILLPYSYFIAHLWLWRFFCFSSEVFCKRPHYVAHWVNGLAYSSWFGEQQRKLHVSQFILQMEQMSSVSIKGWFLLKNKALWNQLIVDLHSSAHISIFPPSFHGSDFSVVEKEYVWSSTSTTKILRLNTQAFFAPFP